MPPIYYENLVHFTINLSVERFSYDLWFRYVFVICFISQWMKRSKHGIFVFPPKKTLIRRRHCSIGQSYASKRSIDSSDMKFFQPSVCLTNQKPLAFVSVRQTNQIALFQFVCCFCFVRAFSFQGYTKVALISVRQSVVGLIRERHLLQLRWDLSPLASTWP